MPTLLVIGDEPTPNASGGVMQRAANFWIQRHQRPPEFDYRTIPSVLSDSFESEDWDAALILLSPTVSEGSLFQVIGRLEELATPSVVLPVGRAARPNVEPNQQTSSTPVFDECILADSRENPDSVPAMLYALAHRQRAVREMQRGLRAANSIQSEAAAELDRLHDELLLAAQVQREVLPKHLPEVDGLSIGVLFRAAGFVSGDIYDAERLDEEHVGFFLADAMGHGVPAALMTLFISGSLPQKEITSNGYRLIPPGESLTRLNRSMCASRVGSTRFATAVCGLIHVPTGCVRLASAGHPPALIIRKGSITPANLDGPLLGVFDDGTFEEQTFTLEPGDRLVVHSDGLEEAYSPRKLADNSSHPAATRHIDALAQIARAHRSVTSRDFITHLAENLDAQAGSMHQHDDVSVLAFSRTD